MPCIYEDNYNDFVDVCPAKRLTFKYVFFLNFTPEYVYYNRFFNKIVKRIVARLANC